MPNGATTIPPAVGKDVSLPEWCRYRFAPMLPQNDNF